MSLQALLHVTRFEPLPIVVAENPGEAARVGSLYWPWSSRFQTSSVSARTTATN